MSARERALDALLGVQDGRSLTAILPAVQEALPPREQRFCQELVYGVLRQYHYLDWFSRQLLKKPFKPKDRDLALVVMLGLYQLFEMRVPDHAAVSSSVDLVRARDKAWAAGLVNGVLRSALREGEALRQQARSKETASYSFPKWLLNFLKGNWPDRWRDIAAASNQRPPMWLRVNQRHGSVEDYRARLEKMELAAQALQAVPGSLLLETPLDVALLPGFKRGEVSVQDVAAQQAARLLAPRDGERILDACAAPGGKTGHIAELAPGSELVAVDLEPARLSRVEENLQRLGQQAELVAADICKLDDWWDGRPFDRVLLDAPCSATGVIRRHPDIKLLRRAEDIAPLVELQSACLDAVWATLKPGGILLYATCSVLKAENEHQIARFLERQPAAQLEPLSIAASVDTGFGSQLLPGNDWNSDGFFYAAVSKRR